jgi:GNAT superfamily N-acetyltransferase
VGRTWRVIGADDLPVAAAIEADVPPFLAELTAAHRDRLAEAAPELQWLVEEDGLPVAVVRGVALRWDGRAEHAPAGGAGEAVRRAGEAGADTLAVLTVTVAFGARGRGVGSALLTDLVEGGAATAGLARTLLLLRTHAKRDYPLVPYPRYVSAVRADGAPFDPWLRAAWRAGLVPVLGVDRSLVARAPLAAWQRWLGLPVPGSGPYLVEGAIKPANLELERDEGRYREPHLWVAPRTHLQEAPSADRGWAAALAAVGVVPGDRAHREVRQRR